MGVARLIDSPLAGLIMNGPEGRERAIKAAARDSNSALQIALAIDDRWYRCQALGWVARFAPNENDALEIVERAIGDALNANDSYVTVGASAWPLRSLVERNFNDQAEAAISRILPHSRQIQHPVRRLDALFLLWQSAFPLNLSGPVREILQELLSACKEAQSWRAGRTLRDIVTQLVARDRQLAEHVHSTMEVGKYQKQAAGALSEGRSTK